MQQDNNLKDRLKLLENQQLPDLSNMDEHWQKMNVLLGATAHVPPLKSSWKKITRRTITYMGVAAVVVTTTYYALKTGGDSNKLRKNIVAAKYQKNNNKPQPKAVTKIATLPGAKPVIHKNQNQVSIARIREESDTVFLMPKASGGSSDISTLENLYSSLKQPVQQFEIDPERDTMLRGVQGTTLKIQAYSFCYTSNEPAKQPVRITMVECYNYTDMLAHQLTTASYDKQLITGGMINLQAEGMGKRKLKLLPGRPIELSMPANGFDPGMQLFVNETRQVRLTEMSDSLSTIPFETVTNWLPAGQPQGYRNTTLNFVRPKKIKLFDIRQSVKGVNQEAEPVFFIKTDKHITDDRIKELIGNKYYTDINKIKLQRVQFFSNEEKAKKTNVMITKDGFVATDSVMISFETAAKAGLLSVEDSLVFVLQVRADSLMYAEKRKADSILYVKEKEFNGRYNFSINGLGWINCDKYNTGTQSRVEFVINVGTDVQPAMSNYTLIFTNIKSVMKGRYQNGQVSFGKLPEGEDVKLICVTENNNKAMACVQSFKISRGEIASLKFEEVTAESFRKKIEKL
ncbi:MAG: hypothetical protein ABI685_10020 [Ferruginibacter sp.]